MFKGINKRLGTVESVVAVDFHSGKVQLLSKSGFTYTEKLDNVELLENTGVSLNGVFVYVKDKVTDGQNTYTVKKVPGGYYPFMIPNKKDFKIEL